MKIYTYGSVPILLRQLNKQEIICVDTETAKLGSDIRLIQIYQPSWDQVLLFDVGENQLHKQMIWDILSDYGDLILHNGCYDFGCFKKDILNFTKPKSWEDTFYLLRLGVPELNTKDGFSLDEGFKWCLGYDPYKQAGLVKSKLQVSFERKMVKDVYVEGPEGLKPLTEEQLLYASIDVYYLPKLYEKLKHLRDHFVYVLDKLTIGHILDDSKGLPVDLDKLKLLENKDISDIKEIDKKLPLGFNVNSYLQVRKLLGTVMSSDEESLNIIQFRPEGLTGLPFRVKQTNGAWPAALYKGIEQKIIKVFAKEFGNTTYINTEEQLSKLKGKQLVYFEETSYSHNETSIKYAELINKKRKALKRLNFVKRARSAMDSDNRIMGTFSPHAINGRIQVDSENLSQYPRSMKSMWGHPQGNGRKLIYSDFAQVELRIICAALPEMNMYNSLKQGIDLHTFVGNNLNLSQSDLEKLPKGISPRFIAKQCNFLLLYGGGVSNFQKTVCKLGGVWFEDDIALKITQNWKEIFSDIKQWHLVNNKSKTNMDQTVSGRRYKAGTVTDLNNIRVSGTGSEIFKLWLHYIGKYLVKNYGDIFIVNRVHDSVVIDCPDDPSIYIPASYDLALCAQSAWFEIIKNAPLKDVPMPVDVKVASNWEDMEYDRKELINHEFTLDDMFMYGKNLEEELLCLKQV